MLDAALIVALISFVAVSHLVVGIQPDPQISPAQSGWLSQKHLTIAIPAINTAMAV